MRPALSDYQHLTSGKVRELYRIDDEHLLFVATDRISAFDYILDTAIPDKGRILTAMSVFFFDHLDVPNHLAGPPDDERIPDEVLGRALVVRELTMLPVECVARGYLSGSGTVEYTRTGSIRDVVLPAGLVEGSKLPAPVFTPSTKAEIGEHDEAIDFSAVVAAVGAPRADELRDLTLALYRRAAEIAAGAGIVLADTKFEFGVSPDGGLVLGDEVLTPDSSRFWPAATWSPGSVQPSYDKQYVRDYLESLTWDKTPPAPKLPEDVIARTSQKYRDALERLTGRKLS